MIQNLSITSEMIQQELKALGEEYEDFTVCRVMKESHDGRPISMLRIGLGMETFVMSAGICGMDRIHPALLVRLAREYCQEYVRDGQINDYPVRSLLNRYSLAILPLLNPDGYEIVRCGFSTIHNPILRQMCKMRGIETSLWKYNARGIDIYHNFPCKSDLPKNLGEYPASEQETNALLQVFEDYDTVGYLNFHSRERLQYYLPWPMAARFSSSYRRTCKRELTSWHLNDHLVGKRWPQEFSLENQGGTPMNYYSQFIGQPALVAEAIQDPQTDGTEAEKRMERIYREIRRMPLEVMNKT